jgi:hypothetical protein
MQGERSKQATLLDDDWQQVTDLEYTPASWLVSLYKSISAMAASRYGIMFSCTAAETGGCRGWPGRCLGRCLQVKIMYRSIFVKTQMKSRSYCPKQTLSLCSGGEKESEPGIVKEKNSYVLYVLTDWIIASFACYQSCSLCSPWW